MMEELLRDPSLKLSKKDFNMGIGEYFCMNTDFLAYQLKQSLNRLGVETIDLVMLQNPYE
jgi:aryl-alcohol dehydrogenase-like predicted oxidoreductase